MRKDGVIRLFHLFGPSFLIYPENDFLYPLKFPSVSGLLDIREKFLITKLKEDDKEAFNCIFHSYYGGLVLYAKEFTNDLDSAEDIVQSIFVKFWIDRNHILINSSLKAYLVRSVHNKCIDFLKHLKIQKIYAEKIQQSAYREPKMDEEVILTFELSERIEKAIENLPENCREVFKKSRYEGKKYREIAEECKLSVKTVEAKIGKALKILKEDLDDLL